MQSEIAITFFYFSLLPDSGADCKLRSCLSLFQLFTADSSADSNCDHTFNYWFQYRLQLRSHFLQLILVQTKTAVTLLTTDSSADCKWLQYRLQLILVQTAISIMFFSFSFSPLILVQTATSIMFFSLSAFYYWFLCSLCEVTSSSQQHPTPYYVETRRFLICKIKVWNSI